MPLMPVGLSAYNFSYNNWGTNPSATPGTSVTPGASNAEGSWTQIASSGDIAQNCYWLHLFIFGANVAGTPKNQLLDIGVDPAGGTSYTAIISNLVMGSTPALTGNGALDFVFPYFIKSGSSVAVRIQGSAATAGTVRVAAYFLGQPTRPEAVPVGSFSQTFGSITNSNGQSFTPGNAADGSWADFGSVTSPLWWFQIGHQVDDATITAERTYVDVAWGDGSNKHVMFRNMHLGTTNEVCTAYGNIGLTLAAYNPVPAGANIYVRGRCENSPDTGYNATVIGIGG